MCMPIKKTVGTLPEGQLGYLKKFSLSHESAFRSLANARLFVWRALAAEYCIELEQEHYCCGGSIFCEANDANLTPHPAYKGYLDPFSFCGASYMDFPQLHSGTDFLAIHTICWRSQVALSDLVFRDYRVVNY